VSSKARMPGSVSRLVKVEYLIIDIVVNLSTLTV
jgi:hypothetical protein